MSKEQLKELKIVVNSGNYLRLVRFYNDNFRQETHLHIQIIDYLKKNDPGLSTKFQYAVYYRQPK